MADVQLSAIAARAGVAPSQILYYFGSRNDALVAAFAHPEQALAVGRSERLGSIDDCTERLAAYVSAYLPEDRHDPVWKLWIEGWLRSQSRAQFAPSGADADMGWVGDLIGCLEHASACGGVLPEPAPGYARRLIFLLDGLAVHLLADHIDPHEAPRPRHDDPASGHAWARMTNLAMVDPARIAGVASSVRLGSAWGLRARRRRSQGRS